MTYFTNTFNLLKISLKVFRANRERGHYHKFVKRLAKDLITKSHALNDGSVNDKIFLKIQWYMVSTLFMGELLAQLTDHKLTEKEQKAFICLGAAGGLSDVLIDEKKYSQNQMLMLLYNNSLRNSALENIFLLYFKNLLTYLETEQKESMIKCMENLFHWQAKSLDQFSDDISEKEVVTITEGKGGLSILLCAIILNEQDEDLKKTLYKLGGFIQLMNDTQDIYKDSRDDIRTYVYFQQSYHEIFQYLDRKRIECFHAIRNLKFPIESKSRFLFSFYAMYIGILYKLKYYSQLTDGKFDSSLIAKMKKDAFRINSFSPGAFLFCYPKILMFNYETSLEEMKMVF